LNTAHRKEKVIQKELETLQQEYPDFQYQIITSGDILEILGE
ncbi:MAG: HAD family hydrolase, partial [Solobacterium sp.]|nr:HAD family hydrolase [Solobacterium sp.]